MRNIKEIFKLINKHSVINEYRKKKFGEVFTQFSLIEEMLDTLPPEVWSNSKLKWLDPANGIGNFPAVILDRLMIGLKEEIKDSRERYKHIMENMIFTCDISSKNTFLYQNIFDEQNKLKLNHYRGSFLEKEFDSHMKNVWNIDKFDVVVGNPPYQDPNKPRHKYWTKFLKKSLDISNYVCFVTPKSASMLLNGLEVDHIKLKCNTLYYNGVDVNEHFVGIGSDFASYLVSNNIKQNYKIIKMKNGDENWQNNLFIPYRPNKIISSIITKTLSFNNEWNRKASRVSESKNGVYNVINSIKTHETVWRKSDKLHEDTNKFKMLYATLGDNYYLDYEKNVMPSTSFVPYIVVDNVADLELLPKISNTKLFKFLIEQFDTMRSSKDFIWKSIKKTFIINDKELYNHFNLTQDEIDLIEKTIK